MAKRALSWKRAGPSLRDLKSAPGKFGCVLSVAVGLRRWWSERFSELSATLGAEARSLMAGDLSARLFHQPTAEEKDKIAAIERQGSGGIRSTWTTETFPCFSAPDRAVAGVAEGC